MRLVSIVTIDDAELSHCDFSKLLRTGHNAVDFWVVVVRATSEQILIKARNILLADLAPEAFMLVQITPCGVSKARNAGIRAFEQSSNRTPEDVVSFPDDDCSYPPAFRENIHRALSRTESDVLLIPYGPSYSEVDRNRWPKTRLQVTADLAPTLVASAGIFVRACRYSSIPLFDEDLGVGTRRKSAEDLEYILRQITDGRPVSYDGFLHIEHVYKRSDPSRIVGNAACVKAFSNQLNKAKVLKTLGRLFFYSIKQSRKSRSFDPFGPVHSALSYGRLHGRTSVGGLLLNVGDPARLAADAALHAARTTQTLVILAAHITSLNSRRDHTFVRAFNKADYSIADGVSLVVVSMLGGGTRVKKMATTDFAPQFLKHLSLAMSRPITFAVLGGEGQTAIKAAKRLETLINGKCVYVSHGFRKDSLALQAEIRQAQPDVVIVGMGMPKEAVWVDMYGRNLGAKALLTCGGWLRLLAGEESRSPVLFQKFQLEWLWRVVTDPRRTCNRYARGLASVTASIRESRRR